MDAELILLPKNCDVRSHFRVSTRDAILYVDRLKGRWGQDPGSGTRNQDLTDAWKQSIGRQLAFRPPDLPAALLWTNTEDHGFLPLQPRRMYTLSLYARSPGQRRRQHGRLAKELKATKPGFQACGPPRLRAFRLQRDFRGEADVRKQEAAPRHTFRARRSGT
jgi:hypothetical protein